MPRAALALILFSLTVSVAGADAAGRGSVLLGLRTTGAGGAVELDPTGVLDHCSNGYCYYSFNAGAVVTLSVVIADRATTFARWLGACSGSQPTCSVTLDQSRSVLARFSPVRVYLPADVNGGSVDVSPRGSSCGYGCTAVPYGTRLDIEAHECCGYGFDHWTGTCASVTSDGCLVTAYDTVDTAPVFTCRDSCIGHTSSPLTREVHATLEILGVGTVMINGRSCSGRCSFDFVRGQAVVLRAGVGFSGWSGSCTGASPRCQFSAFNDPFGQPPRVRASFGS